MLDVNDPISMEISKQLAEEHVEWFLAMLKPLLISHFVHGYKHGKEANNQSFKKDSKAAS